MSKKIQSNPAEALTTWATAIRDWQESRPTRLSDEALVRRYPALGSTKTFKRILSGDLAELRVDEWVEKYRAVMAQIDGEQSAASGPEALYDDLGPARRVRMAVQNLIRSRGIERLVVIQGDTGSGKTSSLDVIEDLFRGSTVRLEASEGWRSFAAAMGDIAVAVGVCDTVDKLPVSGAARLDAIVRHLGEGRRIVLIDEGHHMTAAVLNAIKTMINRTGGLFVVAAQSTLWRKLASASMQEAKQLLHNRLRERVLLEGPEADDVSVYLSRRCALDLDEDTAREIARTAGQIGGFACLRRLGEAMLGLPAGDRDAESAMQHLAHIRTQLAID